MPLSRSRDYLSIGEVLDSVRPDFPDVSISKIRFLEAEGLLTPERTSSGYRKFYEDDVARLRFILSLQRDQFLPLRVIKDRLASGEVNGSSAPSAAPEGAPAGPRGELRLTRAELTAQAGLSEPQAEGLLEYGILASKEGDGYGRDDLEAARAARRLFEFGVEPRHLRLFRQWAEREAAFVQQIVGPGTKKRDPEAHNEALASAETLTTLSQQLRAALLRSSLRELL
ncbi:MAG: MerR family transcriptional regulator [Actinomycetota bacterium]|nr:MerR family transcriptional regulator [Actinomycetota bacterium]